MKHIVVIAGNKTQFNDYVLSQWHKKVNCRSTGRSTIFEGVTFIYVTKPHQLMGYLFSSDSELVRIGTWYTQALDEIQIEEQFNSRKQVLKA